MRSIRWKRMLFFFMENKSPAEEGMIWRSVMWAAARLAPRDRLGRTGFREPCFGMPGRRLPSLLPLKPSAWPPRRLGSLGPLCQMIVPKHVLPARGHPHHSNEKRRREAVVSCGEALGLLHQIERLGERRRHGDHAAARVVQGHEADVEREQSAVVGSEEPVAEPALQLAEGP
jgi:hypothetical protein